MKIYNLPMPQSGTSQLTQLECGQSVIIVGANGAGKTRLGVWIEQQIEHLTGGQHLSPVQRITAQKSLKMPLYSRPTSPEVADAMLRIGVQDSQIADYVRNSAAYVKSQQRWANNPIGHLLSDYE